ncbi:MAG TPA: hypothetical protein VLH77_03645 [Gammaproteobacteria bacterium]|nr:hypothetical protein [Gammaproteobacteria bacterium]
MDNIKDLPFHKLLGILKEYVSVFTNGDISERQEFMRNYPDVFTDELRQYLREFLNGVGVTNELIDELYRRQASILG